MSEQTDRALLDHLLGFDPIGFAGRYIKKDAGKDAEMGLAMAAMHLTSRAKKDILDRLGDLSFSTPITRFHEIVTGYGFEQVFAEPFTSDYSDETLYAYAHRAGMFLVADTYKREHYHVLNGGKVYYNWVPGLLTGRGYLTSSGQFKEYDQDDPSKCLWVGDHHVGEALIHKLLKLREGGELLPKWRYRPSNSMVLSYQDYHAMKDMPYSQERWVKQDAISEARIAQMPQWVRDMIAAEEA